ncbi:hypothetical protein N9D37_01505 [Erythrobacter sp.]|nr:hypothetical protein [Erythrobacter sp.]
MTFTGEGLIAETNLSATGGDLVSLDAGGRYSKTDLFELNVDTRAKDGVRWRG